jgi:hypothetical protein
MLRVNYAECRKLVHYAECHYAECRGAKDTAFALTAILFALDTDTANS